MNLLFLSLINCLYLLIIKLVEREIYMRLDKYLKVARILKRRSVSKEMADSERVYVNGKAAKPAHTVKVGDEVAIVFGQKKLTVRVKMLKEQIKKEEASDLYEIISEEYINELED